MEGSASRGGVCLRGRGLHWGSGSAGDWFGQTPLLATGKAGSMHPTGMLSCLQYKDITIIIIFVLSRLNSTTVISVAKASSKNHKVTLVEKIVLSATCVTENLHRGMINLTNAMYVVRDLGKKDF